MKSDTLVLGLMSGTSLDGLDLALVRFSESVNNWECVAFKTLPYPESWQAALSSAFYADAPSLLSLHLQYGKQLAAAVHHVLLEWPKPDLIASHGHTVFHAPERPLTFALGHGGVLFQETGIPVVSDFRSEDVATGGQGAPLVPVGDRLLFPGFEGYLNLGGFSNFSYLDRLGAMRAGDICAVNIIFNRLAGQLGLSMDTGGQIAGSGKMLPDLFQQLNQLPIYQLPFPRALAREWVENELWPLLDTEDSVADRMHTYGLHVAACMAAVLRENGPGRILVTGGGAYNGWLLDQLGRRSGMELVVPAPQLVEAKEAIIFAALGYLRACGQENVWASVTGNERNRVVGALHGGKLSGFE